MKLINDDATLRLFLPNALTTVMGEASLFEKLAPYLRIAENWMIENVTGDDALEAIAAEGHPLQTLASKAVVCHAFASAVPSLDLVLTPNGFGIVSNANVAPASRDRVERLIRQLVSERFSLLDQLLQQLHTVELWTESVPFAFFRATLFPSLELTLLLPKPSADRWADYLTARMQLIALEADLADNYISTPLYDRLRDARIRHSESDEERRISNRLRSIELALLRGEQLDITALRAIVDMIRKDTEHFPEWTASPVAQLFEPHAFENQKKSTAFWF